MEQAHTGLGGLNVNTSPGNPAAFFLAGAFIILRDKPTREQRCLANLKTVISAPILVMV